MPMLRTMKKLFTAKPSDVFIEETLLCFDIHSYVWPHTNNNNNHIYNADPIILILVKSNQYTVEGFDFAEINDMLCFLVTS